MQVRLATMRPNLTVRFDPHGRTTCIRCRSEGLSSWGSILGCNGAVKNQLDHNYLAVAERHGATGWSVLKPDVSHQTDRVGVVCPGRR